MVIRTSFDFRTDAGDKDPDAHSPTLRQYHKFLWSKNLPNGRLFDLHDTVPRLCLYRASADSDWRILLSGRPTIYQTDLVLRSRK